MNEVAKMEGQVNRTAFASFARFASSRFFREPPLGFPPTALCSIRVHCRFRPYPRPSVNRAADAALWA